MPHDHYCPACLSSVAGFEPGGPRRRPNARCPQCGSLERHRFLALLLERQGPYLATCEAVLDVAPQPQVADVLRRLSGDAYVATDLFPVLEIDVRMDLTRMAFGDNSLDAIVAYHVLEHIPDDRAAMRELSRVLKPGGLVFMQVPWNRSGDTEENPEADEEERLRRFGQVDHVRLYGQDMETRLAENGLRPGRIWPPQILTAEQMKMFGIPTHGVMWILRKSRPYALHEAPEVSGLEPVELPQEVEGGPRDPNVARLAHEIAALRQEIREPASPEAPVGGLFQRVAQTGYHRLREVDAIQPFLDTIAHRYKTRGGSTRS